MFGILGGCLCLFPCVSQPRFRSETLNTAILMAQELIYGIEVTALFSLQASTHIPVDNQCRSTHPGIVSGNTFVVDESDLPITLISCFFFFLYFVEKTLQRDMLDFFQGSRGQDFCDILLMVDGEPIGAHKVRQLGIKLLVQH